MELIRRTAPKEEDLVSVDCPVCMSDNHEQVYPATISKEDRVSFSYTFLPEHTKTFRAVRCRNCSHIFCSPIPRDIAYNYVDVEDSEYLRHSQSRRLSAKAVLDAIRRYVPSGTLLDVGCATGDFIVTAKEEGFLAEGIELSQWSAQIAREKGCNIHRELLETLAARCPEQYDLVTLWGVIEHFARPAQEMRHVKRLLKPGGVVALWTGDVDSVTSHLLGRKWWYWQGQHIQYFSYRSLKKLVEEAGLRPLATLRYPFVMTAETMNNSLRRYRLQPLLSCILTPFFLLKTAWYLRLPGEMLFLARRPLD